MPSVWPVAMRVFLTWFLAAGGATVVSVILLHIPILSRLVGREHTAQRTTTLPKRPSDQQQDALAVEEKKQEQHAL